MSDAKIQELIDDGYEFNAMTYIREAWGLFKKQSGNFIGVFFVYILITMILGLIPFVGQIATYLVAAPLFSAGIFIVSSQIQREESVSFADFFKGTKYLAQLALMSLVMYLIFIAVFSPTVFSLANSGVIEWYGELLANPFNLERDPPPFELRHLWILLLNLLPLLYFVVAYMWAPHFIIFKNKGFWDAMETSRQLITREWLSVFTLMLSWFGIFLLVGLGFALVIGITSAILPFLGVLLAFGFGFVFICLMPVIYISYYTSFAAVTGFSNEETKDEIIDHLVD